MGRAAELVRDQKVQPGGYAGTVERAPAGAGERVLVAVEAFASDQPYEAAWMPRALEGPPTEGDSCLVVFDDLGDAWVTAWWPYE